MSRLRAAALLAGTALLAACGLDPGPPPAAGTVETTEEIALISGVARDGEALVMVGDRDSGGRYYRYRLQPGDAARGAIRPMPAEVIPFPGSHLDDDLEAINVLPDGKIAVLSEQRHAVVGETGLLTQLSDAMAERCNAGVEAMAVAAGADGVWRVAVVWEGGYYRRAACLTDPPADVSEPQAPRLVVLEVRDGVWPTRGDAPSVPLDVPDPDGRAGDHAFRVPAVEWYARDANDPESWELIALCSSQAPGGGGPYEEKWLQRFHVDGTRCGPPLDLADLMPEVLVDGRNWEGLGWFEPGRVLATVNDSASPDDTEVRLLETEEWLRTGCGDEGAQPAAQ